MASDSCYSSCVQYRGPFSSSGCDKNNMPVYSTSVVLKVTWEDDESAFIHQHSVLNCLPDESCNYLTFLEKYRGNGFTPEELVCLVAEIQELQVNPSSENCVAGHLVNMYPTAIKPRKTNGEGGSAKTGKCFQLYDITFKSRSNEFMVPKRLASLPSWLHDPFSWCATFEDLSIQTELVRPTAYEFLGTAKFETAVDPSSGANATDYYCDRPFFSYPPLANANATDISNECFTLPRGACVTRPTNSVGRETASDLKVESSKFRFCFSIPMGGVNNFLLAVLRAGRINSGAVRIVSTRHCFNLYCPGRTLKIVGSKLAPVKVPCVKMFPDCRGHLFASRALCWDAAIVNTGPNAPVLVNNYFGPPGDVHQKEGSYYKLSLCFEFNQRGYFEDHIDRGPDECRLNDTCKEPELDDDGQPVNGQYGTCPIDSGDPDILLSDALLCNGEALAGVSNLPSVTGSYCLNRFGVKASPFMAQNLNLIFDPFCVNFLTQ